MQKAPVDDLFRPGCFLTPAAQRSKSIHQPEHQAQHCQQEYCQCGAHPCRRCNEEGAQQCTAGVAAVHQVHAPGAVGRVIADQNGAGVHDAALGDAHQKKRQRQHRHGTRQAHQAVAHRVADGQQQHTAFHAQRTGQHAHQKPGDQVADAHEREQGAGHAVGKAVLFLQKADHNASTDGADAAEEEGKKACIPQACRLLFHNRPLSVKISSFYLTIIPPHCNRIFLQKVAKSPLGSDDLKCPPLALWASSAEKSFLISRLERPHLRSNESPSGAFKRQSDLRKQMEGRCPDKLCGALQTLFSREEL